MTSDNPLDWNISDVETGKKQLEESDKKAYELNHLFANTFSTPSGKKVLEWLTEHTLESPTWWPGKPPDYGYFREGQNSLMRQIKDKIKQANEYQQTRKK